MLSYIIIIIFLFRDDQHIIINTNWLLRFEFFLREFLFLVKDKFTAAYRDELCEQHYVCGHYFFLLYLFFRFWFALNFVLDYVRFKIL